MDLKFLIQQYVNNIREVFEEKLAELQMFSDRQAAEIEELTNKLIAMGILVIILVIILIVLLIVMKSSKKRRNRRELRGLNEREENLRYEQECLRREEEKLREERRRFEEERRAARCAEQDRELYEEPCGEPQEWPEYNQHSRKGEYGTPSQRSYSGRRSDRMMREESNQETQYFGNDEW